MNLARAIHISSLRLEARKEGDSQGMLELILSVNQEEKRRDDYCRGGGE